MAAVKEFNVGKDTLVDFLLGKGFSKDDLKPTSKLTEDMYRALVQEFQSDKVAKLKSDQIDLPKGSVETRKKKEEETVLFKKDIKKATPVEETKEEPAPPPVPVVETPVVVEEKKIEEPEIIKIEAPEIEAPKVLDKIDLSAIDSSTRPKKGVKKKAETEEPPVEEKPAVVSKSKKKKTDEESQEVEAVPEAVELSTEQQPDLVEEEDDARVIENIKAEKLEGPKILGKIELPVEGEQKPRSIDEKRKRKRIPIERRDQTGPRPELFKRKEGEQRPQTGGNQGGNNFQRGPRREHGNRPQIQRGGFVSREAKEIDKKEIQDKIRETQAKLAGSGGRGKSLKAKYRRAKRDEMAEHAGGEEMQDNKLQLTEFISVSELANLMDVSYA